MFLRPAPPLLLLCVGVLPLLLAGKAQLHRSPGPAERGRAAAAFGRLPLSFEEVRTPHGSRFRARGSGYQLELRPEGADLDLVRSAGTGAPSGGLRMRLLGADDHARLRGAARLPGTIHYLIGNDPAKWRSNVATFGRVRCENVYAGVDAEYYGSQRQLEYDLVVRPHADPGLIRLSFTPAAGATGPAHVDAQGDLVLPLAGGEVRQHRPVLYQKVRGKRVGVTGRYRLLARTPSLGAAVGIEPGPYDRSRALVIDPVLSYASYLGGSGNDKGLAIAVDAGGNTYVAGSTTSTDFPVHDALQQNAGANPPRGDAFVTKLDPTGSTLVYSTYLGGSGSDTALGLAVDSASSPYLIGRTDSPDFPTSHPFQASLRGETDAFVTKLDPSGGALAYSTYLGGTSTDVGIGIAVDTAGQASVVGRTASSNFPTALALQPQPGSGSSFDDAFVARLSADGSSLLFSTYLGGNRQEMIGDEGGIALDSQGDIYVAGSTTSTNFPVTQGVFGPQFGGQGQPDVFVAKVTGSGAALVYAGYLGGSGLDEATGVAVDDTGAAYVGGLTTSPDFPTVAPLQGSLSGDSDGFVAKVSPDGATLVYSTYLGGSSSDDVRGIAVDGAGHATVVGETFSADFPIAHPLQPPGGSFDAFVARLTAAGDSLEFSTFLGGSLLDTAAAVALDTGGSIYVTGSTQSPDFPTVLPLPNLSAGAGGDAFVVKVSAGIGPPVFPTDLHATSVCDTSLSLAWTDNSDNEKTFDIERRSSDTSYRLRASVLANTTTFSDTGLTPNTTYFYRVRASNEDGSSVYSNEFSAKTLTTAVPPPGGLEGAAQSPTSLRLTWTDGSGGQATFQLERSDDGGDTFTPFPAITAGVTTYLDTSLTANTSYVYRIRANMGGCSSAYSPSITVTTPPQPLDAPTNLTARAVSEQEIALSWTDTTNDEEGFRIERKTNSDPYTPVATTDANTTSYNDKSLAANTSYFYRVEAFQGTSFSAPSNEARSTTLSPPVGVLKVAGTLNFGKTVVNGPVTKLLTLRNASRNQRLSITVNAPAAPFSIVSGGGSAELLIGGSYTVKLKYSPTQAGKSKGALLITSSDPHHGSVTVHLQGSAK